MVESFRRRFGDQPEIRIFRAPGRVNLIGEHTDYNLGFVMPVALDQACYVATARPENRLLHVYSENRGDERIWPLTQIAKLEPAHHWSDYVVGVAQQLMQRGYAVEPANLLIRATVPDGAGLSSSAALEVATALALLRGQRIDTLELARLCQQAEREFVGMPCGIMDQYVSVFGVSGAALCIDCRTLEHRPVQLPPGVEIIVVNSMVKHSLGDSAYRKRVAECQAAVSAVRTCFPDVHSLRDADLSHTDLIAASAGEVAARRARHVITENRRVLDFVEAAARQDLDEMGRLFLASHRSLQHDYEVSCPELDFLVDAAVSRPAWAYGARMTGGGFGGCTVNLIRSGCTEGFTGWIREEYRSRYGIDPAVYACKASAGAGEINPSKV